MTRVLVTGACGQIGTELVAALRQKHGPDQVVVTGRHAPPDDMAQVGPHALLDVTDADAVVRAFEEHRPDHVYHLAAQLSAVGEQHPQQAWAVNMGGLYHVLEAARQTGVGQIFWPSSIAAFGPGSPLEATPQDTVMRPTTIYGVAKVAGELLCDYYDRRYDVSVRGVRYPGVISNQTLPGGGTTDYAVEIFYAALRTGRYTCFVRPDTVLPMIYMPDCLDAAIEADGGGLLCVSTIGTPAINVASMSVLRRGTGSRDCAAMFPDSLCEYRARRAPSHRRLVAALASMTACARQRLGMESPRFGLPRHGRRHDRHALRAHG